MITEALQTAIVTGLVTGLVAYGGILVEVRWARADARAAKKTAEQAHKRLDDHLAAHLEQGHHRTYHERRA